MKIFSITKPVAIIALLALLGGCAVTPNGGLYISPGTATGTIAGAAIGAIAGGGRGAAIGAGVGAVTGTILDNPNRGPVYAAPQPGYGYDNDYYARQRWEERRRYEEAERRRIWEMNHPIYWDRYCGCYRR